MKGPFSIRQLSKDDKEQVTELSKKRDNLNYDIEFFLNEDSNLSIHDLENIEDIIGAVGVFDKDRLVATASMGYTVDEDECYKDLLLENDDPRILSNVYVIPEYRNNGIAQHLIKALLENTTNTVFLYFMEDSLISFYEKLNFARLPKTHLGDNVMFLDRRVEGV